VNDPGGHVHIIRPGSGVKSDPCPYTFPASAQSVSMWMAR
jgi:hypothetical protein